MPDWEFAIYDDEVALRLNLDKEKHSYGKGGIYSDHAMVSHHQERYRVINAWGHKPSEEFWKKYIK